MNSHAKWLRQAAEEIANEGHVGWGNTCTAAAEEIERLTAEVTRLTTIATSARCLIMAGDDESKDIDWFKHYDELSALLGIRDSGSHKNDCFCAGICDPTDIRCVKRSGATDSGRQAPSTIDRNHPEATCEACGGPNVVWFVESPLWNKVVDRREVVLCPICFIRQAEAAGLVHRAWELRRESDRDKPQHIDRDLDDKAHKIAIAAGFVSDRDDGRESPE